MPEFFCPQWAPDDLSFDNVSPHGLLKDGFNFTFAGNIGKVQNLENVIRGFALASAAYSKINLNILGDGSNLDALKGMVCREKIKRVYFWGRRPLKEMPRWFEGSDVLVISLIDEPIFSLTVPAKFQAYLAASKPIYCVMKGEVAALVTKNSIGLNANPSEIKSIQQGFEQFLSIEEKSLKSMASNMRVLLENEYDRNQIVETMRNEVFHNQGQVR